MRPTFADFWRDLCAANPDLSDPETRLKMTVAELERLLHRSWDRGVASTPMPSVFESLFGK